jgi:hypothetical protein
MGDEGHNMAFPQQTEGTVQLQHWQLAALYEVGEGGTGAHLDGAPALQPPYTAGRFCGAA